MAGICPFLAEPPEVLEEQTSWVILEEICQADVLLHRRTRCMSGLPSDGMLGCSGLNSAGNVPGS